MSILTSIFKKVSKSRAAKVGGGVGALAAGEASGVSGQIRKKLREGDSTNTMQMTRDLYEKKRNGAVK